MLRTSVCLELISSKRYLITDLVVRKRIANNETNENNKENTNERIARI